MLKKEGLRSGEESDAMSLPSLYNTNLHLFIATKRCKCRAGIDSKSQKGCSADRRRSVAQVNGKGKVLDKFTSLILATRRHQQAAGQSPATRLYSLPALELV